VILPANRWRGKDYRSRSAGRLSGPLQSAAVVLPPSVVTRRLVVLVRAQPDGAIDEFPHQIGVPCVPMGLRDHVHEDPVQCHLTPFWRLPRHVPNSVQRQQVDGGVRV